jgi:hypothetical protein
MLRFGCHSGLDPESRAVFLFLLLIPNSCLGCHSELDPGSRAVPIAHDFSRGGNENKKKNGTLVPFNKKISLSVPVG